MIYSGPGGVKSFLISVDLQHVYYKYYVFLHLDQLNDGWDRDHIMNAIAAEGIPCYSGSCSEIYLEKAFDNMHPSNRLPIVKMLGETSLMFLVHPTLTEKEIQNTVKAVKVVMNEAAR